MVLYKWALGFYDMVMVLRLGSLTRISDFVVWHEYWIYNLREFVNKHVNDGSFYTLKFVTRISRIASMNSSIQLDRVSWS